MRADFVAEVIEAELPAGDPCRHRTGVPGSPESPFSYRGIVDNRTKRTLSLDLRRSEGREVRHPLVRRADVFVTNAPMDSRGRLGLCWEDLEPINPCLIYAPVTASGETGDEAAKAGDDDARAGAPLTVSSPLWVEGGAKVPPRDAPELDEHSSAILAEAGYSEAEVPRLRADGVVVQDKPAAG
jgi:crotonobetainyl-CoA:carnitine CoA-transferase CaiB-like acyl-CoA transferase